VIVDSVYTKRSGSLWIEQQRVKLIDVTKYLNEGENIIFVEARNYYDSKTPGVNIYAEIVTESETINLLTDENWLTKKSGMEEWIPVEIKENPLEIIAPNISCKLVLVARRVELLEDLVLQLSPNSKAEFLSIRCDVSKKDEVTETYGKIANKFERIDVAILNAGIGKNMKVDEYNSELAEDIFGANVFGIIYWIEQLLPVFLKRKEGMIVGISSLADNRGYSGSGFYCPSKAAASIYLEGLRVELKDHNVKVITVKPGFVKSPMTDKNDFKMPFLMETNKSAEIIIEGIKKEKRIIRFPLPTVIGSKLVSYMPSWLYEFLSYKQFHREV